MTLTNEVRLELTKLTLDAGESVLLLQSAFGYAGFSGALFFSAAARQQRARRRLSCARPRTHRY